jgi:L-alanine-DL-glutamate epimerase-like enolase superfamily enzyme
MVSGNQAKKKSWHERKGKQSQIDMSAGHSACAGVFILGLPVRIWCHLGSTLCAHACYLLEAAVNNSCWLADNRHPWLTKTTLKQRQIKQLRNY